MRNGFARKLGTIGRYQDILVHAPSSVTVVESRPRASGDAMPAQTRFGVTAHAETSLGFRNWIHVFQRFV
jgi:hypothetical protein